MIEITLPLPPNRANAREHWRVTHRKKKEYYAAAASWMQHQCRFRRPEQRWQLTATLYVWAKMDPDNAVARLKWPIDCLVNYGLLVDDNEKWLDFTEIPKQVVDRKNQRVVIRLSEAV